MIGDKYNIKLGICLFSLILGVVSIMYPVHGFEAENSRVVVTKEKQVVDSFNGVSAIYRPKHTSSSNGGSDGSNTTYSCAALVKKYYAAIYGVTPYNLLHKRTPIADGYTFKKVSSSSVKVGDISAYIGSSSNHWSIVQGISGANVVLLEQNWKWMEGSTTCAKSDRRVKKTSLTYYRLYTKSGSEVTPKKATQTSQVTTTQSKVVTKQRSVILNASKLTFVKVKKFKLKATIINKKSGDKIKFKTSNKKVATVSSSGTVKKKKKGSATITAYIKGTSIKKTCKVKVKK